ncbi:hypothetical protein [Mammaliicoccus sciuri]|uniref:hypothetical protein n=1 Tax=Mammaliicoccus sciuri TaxID=1296 RepID=UPI00195BD37C|nr:hypothetical protein [Mammaliicoccus sciuri]
MKLLITLSLSTLALFIYVKRSYKYASVDDTVEAPIDYESDKKEIKNNGRRIVELKEIIPIDYEETQAYKDNEVWFTGMGRC